MTMPAHLLAEQAAFLAAIRAEPDSDTPRLVYADWLTERGEELGDVECGRCEGEGGYHKSGPPFHFYQECPDCRGTGTVSNGLAERATFIREQIAYYHFHGGHHTDATTPSGKGFGIESCSPFSPAVVGRDPVWLRVRLPDHRQIAWIVCERGWVRDVRCPWAWWAEHHATILAHPDVCLRRVELTTWPEDAWMLARDPFWDVLRADAGRRSSARQRLADEFPGHCPYHPIQWVLPGERDEPQVTMSFCVGCSGLGREIDEDGYEWGNCPMCDGTGILS